MKRLLFILISAILFAGCNPAITSTPSTTSTVSKTSTSAPSTPAVTTPPSNNTGNKHAEVQQQLAQAQAKWQKQKNAHYIYTLQRSCFCGPEARKPMRIRVKDNEIVQVLLVPENITKPVNYQGALSVSGLFNLVQKAIDSNAASIKVSYDAQYGYPVAISIDQDIRMADEEIYYKASGMRLL